MSLDYFVIHNYLSNHLEIIREFGGDVELVMTTEVMSFVDYDHRSGVLWTISLNTSLKSFRQ